MLPVPGVVRLAAVGQRKRLAVPTAVPTRELSVAIRKHPAALVALAGYLAGGAVATKYPAVLFVLIPLAIWTFVGRSWRKETRQGSAVGSNESCLEGIRPRRFKHSSNPEP